MPVVTRLPPSLLSLVGSCQSRNTGMQRSTNQDVATTNRLWKKKNNAHIHSSPNSTKKKKNSCVQNTDVVICGHIDLASIDFKFKVCSITFRLLD